MRSYFRNIIKVAKREIKFLSKDMNIISVVLLAPVFYAFFYSTIYSDKIETNVPIAIVDDDRSITTKKLIRYFDSHQLTEVSRTAADISEAGDLMNSGQVQAILYFPNNFESDLKSGYGASLKLGLNTTRFLVSNDVNKAVNEVIGSFNLGIRLEYLQKAGLNKSQAVEIVEPIITDTRSLYNFTESYGDFLIPGMLVLILQQTLLIGLSESMAKERENRLLQDLFRVSGDSV